MMKTVVFVLLSWVSQVFCVCENLPVVEKSESNVTSTGPYSVGTIVEVVCDKEYAPVGNAYFTCNGTQFVGNLTCNIRTCPRIDTPSNCRIVNEPSYEAGCVIIYDSNPGYVKVGQGTLLCRDDNRWSPEHPPVCKPRDCGYVGNIANGQTNHINTLNGVRNAYGSVLRIDCDDGYVLNGHKYVRCHEDGTWDSRPTCEPVKCPPFLGLYSSCVNTAALFLNHYYMNCRNDVSDTKVGGDNVQCQDNGEWSSEYLGCYCDCKVETDMTHITVSNLKTKGYIPHGQTLSWSCKDGYVKNTTDVIKCIDGNMATPSCQLDTGKPYPLQVSPANENNSALVVIVVVVLVVVCGFVTLLIRERYTRYRKNVNLNISTHKAGEYNLISESESTNSSLNHTDPSSSLTNTETNSPLIHTEPSSSQTIASKTDEDERKHFIVQVGT